MKDAQMKIDADNHDFCKQEQAVAAAVLAGAISDDLLAHIGICAVCTEVVMVSQSLLHDVAPAPEDLHVPDASLVWRRAQRLARQQAITKATRPIRIARICAYVAAILALPWAVFTFQNSPTWMPDVSRPLSTIDHSVSVTLTGTAAVGIVATLIFLSLSSWYVLRQE